MVQDNVFSPGVKSLRNNLSVISALSPTHPVNVVFNSIPYLFNLTGGSLGKGLIGYPFYGTKLALEQPTLPESEKCGGVVKAQRGSTGVKNNKTSGMEGTEYVTTKDDMEEPLLGRAYVGWRRTIDPNAGEMMFSDTYGGNPIGMTHRFIRVNNGNTIKDVIRPYGRNGEPMDEINTTERIINNGDTLYWPDRERFFNLMKSKHTFASGRPNWIILDQERNKINNK